MTDKRKQRARKLMAEKGYSYQAALNLLRKEAAERKAQKDERTGQEEGSPQIEVPHSDGPS